MLKELIAIKILIKDPKTITQMRMILHVIQTSYELFGIDSINFNSYKNSSITLLRCLLGDINYRQYQELDKVIGPVFFVSYVVIVYLLLMNMVVAIISEVHDTVRSTESTDYMFVKIRNFYKQTFPYVHPLKAIQFFLICSKLYLNSVDQVDLVFSKQNF